MKNLYHEQIDEIQEAFRKRNDSLQSEVDDYKDKVRKGKVKGDIDTEHLASIADNDEYIANIVSAELSGIKGCQKWIVFCRNIEELMDIQPNIPKWFKCFNQSVNH